MIISLLDKSLYTFLVSNLSNSWSNLLFNNTIWKFRFILQFESTSYLNQSGLHSVWFFAATGRNTASSIPKICTYAFRYCAIVAFSCLPYHTMLRHTWRLTDCHLYNWSIYFWTNPDILRMKYHNIQIPIPKHYIIYSWYHSDKYLN